MARRSFGNVRKLPSGRWQATYTDVHTGGRVAAPDTFPTKTDANVWLATVEADAARGDLLDPRLTRRPFSEWADEWLVGLHVKPKTRLAYESSLRNHVLPAFEHRQVASVTYRDCKQFVDDLAAKGLAPGTVGEARKVLRLVLREALRADAISRNPADGIRIPRGERQEMQFLTAEEVFALADAVEHPPRPRSQPLRTYPQYGLLVRFAAFTGLRAGEIGALASAGSTRSTAGWRSPSPSRRSTANSSTAHPRPTPAAASSYPPAPPTNSPTTWRSAPATPTTSSSRPPTAGPSATPTSTVGTSSPPSPARGSIRPQGSTTFATLPRR